jgi:putative phosphoribosyl transferase
MTFRDRVDAGRRLALRLAHLRGEDVVVLGLPRGGVPVALQVALSLGAPLDVIVVRKLGLPAQPELAMGAIGEDGVRVVNRRVLDQVGVPDTTLAAVEARERAELERRVARLRQGHARVPLTGCTAVIVDDGLATGATARAACQVARAHGARRVVLAVPVAPYGWEQRIGADADEFVAVRAPHAFDAVGQFYDDFAATSDDEVVACLDAAQRSAPEAPGTRGAAARALDETVAVPVGSLRLPGRLAVPKGATGLVVFAHGSGSSHLSPRNGAVAAQLQAAGLGTLLFDLLTRDEEQDRTNVFDVELLAGRLGSATTWLREQPGCTGLPIGCFGASTGVAAALWLASIPDAGVGAVVSRGGRPDLAGDRLEFVAAPTLLIVGGRDDVVLDLNRAAAAHLHCVHRVAVVPGATHLFEEPGTLAQVADLAAEWFVEHLVASRPTT